MGMTNLLNEFKINVRKIAPSTSVHFLQLVCEDRLLFVFELSFKFFTRRAACKMRASDSSRVSTFLL